MGLELPNHEIMTWAEVGCLTIWTTQLPQRVIISNSHCVFCLFVCLFVLVLLLLWGFLLLFCCCCCCCSFGFSVRNTYGTNFISHCEIYVVVWLESWITKAILIDQMRSLWTETSHHFTLSSQVVSPEYHWRTWWFWLSLVHNKMVAAIIFKWNHFCHCK